jgi:hypothetical protein
MPGETNLEKLIAEMHPVLDEAAFVFCTVTPEDAIRLTFTPLGVFRESEGVTLIMTQEQATDAGLRFDSTWARVTLTVHSALAAVGFLAAVLGRLAQAGISVNPVSAFFHDHLFVPWESRQHAMDVLEELSHTRAG